MATETALEALVHDLKNRVEILELELGQLRTKTRGGPKSEKPMEEIHAFRVRFGDLKDASHKEAADALGLSYGQVFSCRGGYTFKTVKPGWQPTDEKIKAPTKSDKKDEQ